MHLLLLVTVSFVCVWWLICCLFVSTEEERRARESEPKQITSSERRLLQLHVDEATDIAYLEKEVANNVLACLFTLLVYMVSQLQKMKVTLDEVQADTIKR